MTGQLKRMLENCAALIEAGAEGDPRLKVKVTPKGVIGAEVQSWEVTAQFHGALPEDFPPVVILKFPGTMTLGELGMAAGNIFSAMLDSIYVEPEQPAHEYAYERVQEGHRG